MHMKIDSEDYILIYGRHHLSNLKEKIILVTNSIQTFV